MTTPKAIDQVRAALAPLERGDSGSYQKYMLATSTANMREILADYSAMEAEIARSRKVVWTLTEHNALHFGESYNTVIQGSAALAKPDQQMKETK